MDLSSGLECLHSLPLYALHSQLTCYVSFSLLATSTLFMVQVAMNSMTHSVVALLIINGLTSRCTITSLGGVPVYNMRGMGDSNPRIYGLKIDVGFPHKNLKAEAFRHNAKSKYLVSK
jgi:hypothetical protein